MKTAILKRLLFDKSYRFDKITLHGLNKCLSDKRFLEKKYKLIFQKKLDLNNPMTFNEKLQWLKLNERDPLYTQLVDKYEVKKYIAEKIGEEYIIPTLGVWNTFDEIDFDSLPNQFVLKCTHDSGGIVICKDKDCFNKQKAKYKINKSLKKNFYWIGREWPYKNVKPRIIAEQYMEDSETNELRDYKLYCFNGKVKMFMISSNRFLKEQTYFDYFDEKKNRINGMTWGNPNSPNDVAIPNKIDEMIELAERLSKNIPHVRVDLYLANNQIFFGEMTFFDGSGFEPILPEDWDYRLGKWLNINNK